MATNRCQGMYTSLKFTLPSTILNSHQVARPTLQASNPQVPILKSSQITPRDLAIALGLLEGDHYKALQPSDYLQHLSKGQSDSVKIYNETNERIKLWVTRSILSYDTVSSRSQLVKFYINTAFVSPRNKLSTYPCDLTQRTSGMLFDAKLFIDRGDFYRSSVRSN